MNLTLRLQLSLMMFIQFFVWGAWYVTGPNYLGTIGFTATDFGWTYAVGPIAGMISPFFVGMIADRFFPAQRVLGVMHILGAAIMLFATTMMKAQNPSPDSINIVFFGYQLTYFPTLALANTLAMNNMTNPEKDFPGIRVLGTIGWIAAGLALTMFGWEKGVEMFYLTAGAALLLGLYSFTLPHTPPVKEGKVSARQVLGLDAFVLLKDRNYLIFMLSSLLICIPLAFYYQIASRIVEMTGLADRPDHVVRPDVGDLLHAGDAVVLRAAGREVDAGRGHAGVGRALRAVRTGRARRNPLDDPRRHHAARHLLRLLLRDRADLHRPGRADADSRAGSRHARALHPRPGHGHRRVGGW